MTTASESAVVTPPCTEKCAIARLLPAYRPEAARLVGQYVTECTDADLTDEALRSRITQGNTRWQMTVNAAMRCIEAHTNGSCAATETLNQN